MNLALHPEFIKQSATRRYLLGISGGRDSVAMLRTLLDAGYQNLVLCHLNHGLRSKESGQDASFVRRLAKKHHLPCEVDRINVEQRIKQSGESMELAARNSRHEFFARCARLHRCPRILLAHHADDQVETILFNLLRGSGGLRGMKFLSTHMVDGKELIFNRPLLQVNRTDIDHYLRVHKISYREDQSNAEAIAVRNRLRNEAIPLLNEIMNRNIGPNLLRAEAIFQQQETALHQQLDELQLLDPQGRLFLPQFTQLSSALQSMAMLDYLRSHGISDISQSLLERCLTLAHQSDIAKINLPGNRFLRRKEKRIFIS